MNNLGSSIGELTMVLLFVVVGQSSLVRSELPLTVINPVIQARLHPGIIEGQHVMTESGAESHMFLGVPYAQPPVGQLRFRKTEPPLPWSGVLQCKEQKSACWQNYTTREGELIIGKEDCLYMNVYAGVDCSPANPCPVLIYYHGGGFVGDYPGQFDASILIENFASRHMIMIAPSFRLNVFAFWTLGGSAGNYAIYDMIASLKWIQHEIRALGGDAAQVTIMGQSSGSMSVSYLTLSPRTEGLFKQAIMISGSSTTSGFPEENLSGFWEVSDLFNCTGGRRSNDRQFHQEVADCLRQVPADAIGYAFSKLSEGVSQSSLHIKSNLYMWPRLDGPDGLFPKTYDQLLAERRPIRSIIGTTQLELMTAQYENTTRTDVIGECELSFGEEEDWLRRECERVYTPTVGDGETLNMSDPNVWVQQRHSLIDDKTFHGPAYAEAASLRARGAVVYLYSFDYRKLDYKLVTPFHSFDLSYINGMHLFDFDDRDRRIQIVYSSLFANFAKGLAPTGERNPDDGSWRPLDWPYGFNYYSIDLPDQRMRTSFHLDGILFWNYIVPAHRKANQRQPIFRSADQQQQQSTDGFVGVVEFQQQSLRAQRFTYVSVLSLLAVSLVVVGVTYAIVVRSNRKPRWE